MTRSEGTAWARLEGKASGRALISLFILVTLLAVTVTNLPDSSLRRGLSKKTQPYLNAIGLDQNWGVFAPDPRREVLELKARILYRDGTAEPWTPPVRGDLVGEYSDYRWQKFMENVIAENGPGLLTDSTAAWVARERRTRAEVPDSVTLVKRSAFLPPPGPEADDPLSFTEVQLLQLPVTAKILRGGRP